MDSLEHKQKGFDMLQQLKALCEKKEVAERMRSAGYDEEEDAQAIHEFTELLAQLEAHERSAPAPLTEAAPPPYDHSKTPVDNVDWAYGAGQERGYSDGYGDCLAGNKPFYQPTPASELPVNPIEAALGDADALPPLSEHAKVQILWDNFHSAYVEREDELRAAQRTIAERDRTIAALQYQLNNR